MHTEKCMERTWERNCWGCEQQRRSGPTIEQWMQPDVNISCTIGGGLGAKGQVASEIAVFYKLRGGYCKLYSGCTQLLSYVGNFILKDLI